MKLSEAQEEVLALITEGEWELGKDPCSRRVWFQKGSWGRGGPIKNVHMSTFLAIYKRGWVTEKENQYPTLKFELTPAGRQALLEAEGAGAE